MSFIAEPAHALLAEAKAAVIDAAKAIDPLSPMRIRPFISVGVAAGVGALLGMNRGRLLATLNLMRAICSFMRPVALAVGRYVVARASQAATEMRKEPAPTLAPTYAIEPEEIMTEAKEKTAEFNTAKAQAKRDAEAPTYRTILVAACVGVLIGLLLRR